MKGTLVVNNFVTSSKFTELYEMLNDAAKKRGIIFNVKKTGELPHNYEILSKIETDFFLFWDKDVILAGMLEDIGFKVFNSKAGIENCDNKAITYRKLSTKGVPTPKTIVAPLTFEGVGYNDLSFLEEAGNILGYPFVIKELYGSFGQQVSLVNNYEEAKNVIKDIGSKGFLMQEFIKSTCGKDLRINVVGGKVIATMLRENLHGDFRSNITNGGEMWNYHENKEEGDIAVKAVEALGLDFSGVDVMFGPDGHPLICEVNSNPHFRSTFLSTGVNMAEEILDYIVKKVGK